MMFLGVYPMALRARSKNRYVIFGPPAGLGQTLGVFTRTCMRNVLEGRLFSNFLKWLQLGIAVGVHVKMTQDIQKDCQIRLKKYLKTVGKPSYRSQSRSMTWNFVNAA